MNFIRRLDTNFKLYACFALLAALCAGLTLWMLSQLGLISELAARAARAGAADAGRAAQVRADYALASLFAWLAIGADAAVAAALALWLRAEVARPVHQAVGVARKVAAGDLSSRINPAAAGAGDAGLLLLTMQEMNDRLVGMIVKVRSGADTISSGAGEIASGNMDLSARTERQAAALEQTASSMEQLTATVKQNAENAHQASKLAVSASEVAVKGGDVVAEVVGTMASINDSSKRIAEIIGVIDGIAFQTNILALNAAVEAARAGEQGRGFAVVAAEVRSLAQRSAAAAKEIKALIDDSVEKVSAGTTLADRAGATMHEVVSSVKRVTDIIGEIASASAEQTAGIEQVNQAITAMDQATQENASLVEQSAAAAASMRDQAGSLARVVGAFALGPEHARPGAQIHLIASNPKRIATTRQDRTRPRIVAVRTAPRGAAASPDIDWEEF